MEPKDLTIEILQSIRDEVRTTSVREMTSVLRAQHDLRPRIERCERDIDDLKRRIGS